jgi:hypothetical protein
VTDHRLGPGFEVELVFSRTARPVAISAYVDFRYLFLVSESTTSFTDPAAIALSTVERGDALSFGAGVGLTWMAFGR